MKNFQKKKEVTCKHQQRRDIKQNNYLKGKR